MGYLRQTISPIAAQTGQRVKASVKARCSCERTEALNKPTVISKVNPTCPVHGAGRPAGTGK